MMTDRNLNIGFITMEYPHPSTGNSGGLGTSIKHLVLALSKKGHQVSVFTIHIWILILEVENYQTEN